MFILTLIILINGLYKIYNLKKTILAQENQLLSYKNKNEDFAISLSKIQNNQSNTLIDSMTNLLTKEAFENQFTHLLSESKRFNYLFAICILEISYGMPEAEKYSQITSDKIFIEVGNRLKKTLREVDIISRNELNDFVVLLPNIAKPEIIVHAVERLIESIKMPFETDGHPVQCSVNVGIAIFSFDGEDKQTLIANAKHALTIAKANGKDIFQFYQEETHALGKRELALKTAIKDTDFLQRVTLEYSPYYNTVKDEIECIEVIASMNHPELGKISFSDLSRVSHYSARMFELYEWMIKTSVEKFANDSSPKHALLFRLDLMQLGVPQFAKKIIAIINKVLPDKTQIIIELIDNVEATNLIKYRNLIMQLNDSGIPIAIGILVLGHFALNNLNHIHFRYLKIDKELVNNVEKRKEARAILERILSLADSIKIRTLTPGVDTIEQKQLLELLGCVVMQGKVFNEVKLEVTS